MSISKCLIFGVDGELGQALRALFMDSQWHVIGVGRRDYKKPNTESFTYHKCDLSCSEDIEGVLTLLPKDISIVIFAHVIYPKSYKEKNVYCDNFSDAQYIYSVNALSQYYLTTRIISLYSESFTCFVSFNSESIFHSDGPTALYSSSKAALKVMMSSLAVEFKEKNISIVTIILGPLVNKMKVKALTAISEKMGITVDIAIKKYLSKSNRDLTISNFISHKECYKSILYAYSLNKTANGMVIRLDGGSAGTYI